MIQINLRSPYVPTLKNQINVFFVLLLLTKDARSPLDKAWPEFSSSFPSQMTFAWFVSFAWYIFKFFNKVSFEKIAFLNFMAFPFLLS